MKAYLIDPKKKTIEQVDYSGDFKQIYEFLDCRAFDIVHVYENGDVIYVDDEGLFVDEQHFFIHRNYPTPLAGKGLIIGTDEEGEDQQPKTSFEDFENDIKWVGDRVDVMSAAKLSPNDEFRHLFFM